MISEEIIKNCQSKMKKAFAVFVTDLGRLKIYIFFFYFYIP